MRVPPRPKLSIIIYKSVLPLVPLSLHVVIGQAIKLQPVFMPCSRSDCHRVGFLWIDDHRIIVAPVVVAIVIEWGFFGLMTIELSSLL